MVITQAFCRVPLSPVSIYVFQALWIVHMRYDPLTLLLNSINRIANVQKTVRTENMILAILVNNIWRESFEPFCWPYLESVRMCSSIRQVNCANVC